RPTASSSESSEQWAPATLGWPGTSASAAVSWISGSPTSNAESAYRGSVMISIGPSHTASTERGSPIATNGGRPKLARLSQHFARTSGPIPAGSPRQIASGSEESDATRAASIGKAARVYRKAALAEFDHRIPAKVAQIPAGAKVEPLLVDLVEDLVVGRRRRVDFVAPANHQHPDALVERAERLCGLPDLHRQHQLLQRGRQVTHLDLVLLDDLTMEIRRDLVRAATAPDGLGGFGEARDHRFSLFARRSLGETDRY